MLTETPVTCSGSVQQPAASTQSVCACPSGILLEPLSGGANGPCADYVGSQGDLIVPTNACPSANSAKLKRAINEARIPPGPLSPRITDPPQLNDRALLKNVKRDGAGSYSLTIQGVVPCASNTIYAASTPIVTSGSSPEQSSLCAHGGISMNAAAYSFYQVYQSHTTLFFP